MNTEDDILYCKTFINTSDNPLWGKFIDFFNDYDVRSLSKVKYLYY